MTSFATDRVSADLTAPDALPNELLQIVSGQPSLQFEASTPALEVMRALEVADYAVILCQQQFVGLITPKEILKAVATGIDLSQCSIGGLTLRLPTLDASELANLMAVAQRFQQHQVQYLPVLRQQQVVGVLTLAQVANQMHQLLANPAAFWLPPETRVAQPVKSTQTVEPANLMQLAGVSHEIRASMSGISAFVELLSSDASIMQNYAEALDCIEKTCCYLLALTDDIGLFAQIEAHRTLPQQETCNLHELLKDLKQRFQLQARAQQLEFFLEQDGALPQYIITDPIKLRRILDNLLGNALKFTPCGRVTLKLTVRDKIYFEVRDTGVGIAAHEQDLIFEPFVQAVAGKQSAQGVGLGLAISRGLAQMLGGEIWVSSRVGQGTIVHLALPVQKRLLQTGQAEPTE